LFQCKDGNGLPHQRPHGREAAIHSDHLTGDACCLARQQANHGVRQLSGSLQAAQRVLLAGTFAHRDQVPAMSVNALKL